MKSKLLADTADLTRTFQDWCAKADDIRIVTAWATTDCVGCSELTAARSQISTLVIGLDFYSTSPSFLDAFRSNVRIGKANGSATFHPKVYLFTHGELFCCLLGSSNFTGGGFGDNSELNICITGTRSEAFFADITGYIDTQEQQADEISSPEIADYRDQFEKMAAARAKLSKFRASADAKAKARAKRAQEAKGAEPPEQLNKMWAEYVQLIRAQEQRRGLIVHRTPEDPGYLETAESMLSAAIRFVIVYTY